MIPDELDALRTAAARDDPIAVMASIERLDVAFERDRSGSKRFDTMAVLLDQRIDDSNDDGVRNGYREAIVELEQRRIELDRSTLAYVEDEDSPATLVESVDAVDEAYRVCQERTVALETIISTVLTSPMLIVWSDPVIETPKGMTVDAEVVLSTIGRPHLDSIDLDVESEIPASVASSTVEGLDVHETATVQVELSPPTAGEFDVFVTASGETNADRLRFTVLVLAKRDYVVRASRLVASLETMLDSTRGRRNGLRNQARTLRRRLESISDDLEKPRRPARSIDNRLGSARNSVEAMKREISSFEPGVERQEVLYLLEDITEGIDSAIEALS